MGDIEILVHKLNEKYYSKATYKVLYQGSVFINSMEFKLIKEEEKLLIEEFNTDIN